MTDIKNLLNELSEIEKSINKIEHIIYVSYPLIQEKKLLLKILEDIKTAVARIISIILQYDAAYKKIKLQEDPRGNLRTFIEKCAPRYEISREQIRQIFNLLDLVKQHQDSSMEFKRHEKIVILSEYSPPKTITLEEIKVFSSLLKDIFTKTSKILKPSL